MNRLIAFLIAFLLAIALSGCQPDNTGNTDKTTDSNINVQQSKETDNKLVTIYTVAPDGEFLIKSDVKQKYYESAPKTALEALLSYPGTKDSPNPLAKANVKLLSFEVKKGMAVVSFSPEIKKIKGGSMQELLMIGSIVNTLTEFKEIKSVQILVDGHRVETLLGHMDLTDPLERDETIIYKQNK